MWRWCNVGVAETMRHVLKKLVTAGQTVDSTSLFGNELVMIIRRMGRSATRTPMALPPGRNGLFAGDARCLVAEQIETVAVEESVGGGGSKADGEKRSCHVETRDRN